MLKSKLITQVQPENKERIHRESNSSNWFLLTVEWDIKAKIHEEFGRKLSYITKIRYPCAFSEQLAHLLCRVLIRWDPPLLLRDKAHRYCVWQGSERCCAPERCPRSHFAHQEGRGRATCPRQPVTQTQTKLFYSPGVGKKPFLLGQPVTVIQEFPASHYLGVKISAYCQSLQFVFQTLCQHRFIS